MKVNIKWLQELVELKTSTPELITLLNNKTIGTKDVTDEFIELDMKGYNRADLLSLRGVAYEVAAITDSKILFEEPDESKYFWVEKNLPKLEVTIEDSNDCPLYCLVKIEGVSVNPSSPQWVEKLKNSGIRSINNIADITNLLMLEYGQPLHAFDASKIEGGKIVVRRATKGEKIITLDGKSRELSTDNLVIADSQKPAGIAGVMGGKDSEISDKTTTVLLEAAIFNPTLLRRTATNLALNSEASKRFYHGLTQKRLLQALNRAIEMFEQLGGKVTSISISGEVQDPLPKIPTRLKKIRSLIGEDVNEDKVESYLKKLNVTLSDKVIKNGDSSWVVTPPFFRLDLQEEEDIVEEIARMHGYENISSQQIPSTQIPPINQEQLKLFRSFKNIWQELGFTEVFTYPYYSTKVLSGLGFEGEFLKMLIRISNPISRETEYLRLNLWPNLLEAAAKNFKKGYETMSLFELGKTYSVSSGKKPVENFHLAFLVINNGENPIPDAYQVLTEFINQTGLKIQMQESPVKGVPENFFHPKRNMAITFNDQQIGGISEIHLKLADKFGLPKRAAVGEFDLTPLTSDNDKRE